MFVFLRDELFNDINNKPLVEKILEPVQETCLFIDGYNPVEEARNKIRELGETRVANSIIVDA